jgi:hypothetical protein
MARHVDREGPDQVGVAGCNHQALPGVGAMHSPAMRAAESRRSRLPVHSMGVLVAAVILLIQDLDRPSTGFIMVSQQPMMDAAAGIEAYSNY